MSNKLMHSYTQVPNCEYKMVFACQVTSTPGGVLPSNYDCMDQTIVPGPAPHVYMTMDVSPLADDLSEQLAGVMPTYYFKPEDYTLRGDYTIRQTLTLPDEKYSPNDNLN